MIDPTKNEQQCIEHGGRTGGEYLDSIGKTDLGLLTKEEYQQFCQCVVGGYCESMAEFNTAPPQ